MNKSLLWVILLALAVAASYETGLWRKLLPGRASQPEGVALAPVPAKPTAFELHSEPELTNSTRKLLYEARYAELEQQLELLRQDAARDPANEYRLIQAYSAFDDAELRMREEIDAWIQERPESGEALIARARQRAESASKRRGGGFAKEVAEEAMADFGRLMELSAKDAERAIVKLPQHPVAWMTLLRASCGTVGTDCLNGLAQRIDEQVPASYAVHKTAMHYMQPRWGGSYRMMEKYAEYVQKHAAKNPRLAILRGFPSWAAGEDAYTAKNYQAAYELYDRALAFGEDGSFFHDRANALIKLNRYGEALADLRRWHERWPSKDSAEALDGVRKRMREAAYDLHREKKHEEALQAYDAYLEVWPDDEDAHFYRAELANQLDKYGEALRSYRRVIEINPTRFEAVKGADHTLAREKRWDEILPLWAAYLALKPEHGEAYFERGGTYFQMGDMRNAYENAAKACDLGHAPACAWRNRLKTHPSLK